MLLLLFRQAPVTTTADVSIDATLPALVSALVVDSGERPTILGGVASHLRDRRLVGVTISTRLPRLETRMVVQSDDTETWWLMLEGVVVDTERLSV